MRKKQGSTALKIAMLGHKRIPSREGGVEIVVEELSTRLAAAGNLLHVYNRRGHHVAGKELAAAAELKSLREYKGIKIITIPTFENGMLNAFTYSVLAAVRTLFGRYDCIHYHAEGSCAMLWLPHLFGIHTVVTIHGLDWKRAKWGGFAEKYLKFGEKMAARYADEIIVLSKNVEQYFQDTYNRKVHFIPNAVVRQPLRDDRVICEKWGLKKDEYLLFLGRIVPEKGIQYLIDAYQRTETDKKLIIAGGSSHTREFLQEMKKRAEKDERVLFTGFVQGEELEELFSNAYLYILPSDLEGMPISLLEAMSYGNCCLVSDIPECSEVVEDKAVTFRNGDVNDLQDKLSWLLHDPETVKRYKESAAGFICSKYDWDVVVENTQKLYRKDKKIPEHLKENEALP